MLRYAREKNYFFMHCTQEAGMRNAKVAINMSCITWAYFECSVDVKYPIWIAIHKCIYRYFLFIWQPADKSATGSSRYSSHRYKYAISLSPITMFSQTLKHMPAGTTEIVQDRNKTICDNIYISDSLSCPYWLWNYLAQFSIVFIILNRELSKNFR